MGGPVHNAHQSIFTKLKSDVHLIWIKTQTKIRACLLFYFCIQHECELIWIWRAVSSFALTPCVFLRWQNQATRPYTPKSRWTFCVGAFEQSQSNFPSDMEIFSIWKVKTYLCVTTNDHLKHWISSVSFVNENDFDIRAKQSYYFSFLAKKNEKEMKFNRENHSCENKIFDWFLIRKIENGNICNYKRTLTF